MVDTDADDMIKGGREGRRMNGSTGYNLKVMKGAGRRRMRECETSMKGYANILTPTHNGTTVVVSVSSPSSHLSRRCRRRFGCMCVCTVGGASRPGTLNARETTLEQTILQTTTNNKNNNNNKERGPKKTRMIEKEGSRGAKKQTRENVHWSLMVEFGGVC